MSLSDRLTQLEAAAARRDGDAGVEILRAIEVEHGPDVAAVITADLIAAGIRNAQHATSENEAR